MPDVKEVLEFAGVEVLQDAVDDLYLQLQQISEALSKETRIALDYQKQRDELRAALEEIADMRRTHDHWEIVKDAPRVAEAALAKGQTK